jgi:hypothetical protein
MSRAGGEAEANGDKKYVVSINYLNEHVLI